MTSTYDRIAGTAPSTSPSSRHRQRVLPQSQSMEVFHVMPTSSEFRPPLPSLGRPSTNPGDTPPPLPPPNKTRRNTPASVPPARHASISQFTGDQEALLPQLPPKPPLLPPKQTRQHSQSTYDTPRMVTKPTASSGPQSVQEEEFKIVSESMSLEELTEKHQQDFPLKIKVSAGIFGSTERDTFSDGDLLNIHFVKQAKYAVVQKYGGRNVKVPLNSALQFGVLYNPENNIKGAQIGYEFRTANQLMAHKPLPRVVCALQAFKGSSAESSVEANDILLIEEVKPGRPFSAKHIVCTLLTDGRMLKKKLPENCVGCFTTKPDSVKLFLPEIIHHFQLPVQVMVFLSAGYEDSFNESLFCSGEVVSIVREEVEQTVIATSALEETSTCTSPFSQEPMQQETPMFDIPINIPVMEVQIIEPREEDCEKLYEDTRCLFENYDPTDKARQIRIPAGDDLYYSAVRDDKKNAGVELIAPESIYMTRPRNTPAYDSKPEPTPVPTPAPVPKQAPAPEPLPGRNTTDNVDEYVYAVNDVTSTETPPLQSSPLYNIIEQIGKSKQQQIDMLQKKMKALKTELEQTQASHKELIRTVRGKCRRVYDSSIPLVSDVTTTGRHIQLC